MNESPDGVNRFWHAVEPSIVVRTLGSDLARGLSEAEARFRLGQFGPNEIEEAKRVPSWRMFLDQFRETLMVILIVAAIISLFIGEAIDSAVILAIVFASAGLGFYQEHRAEHSLALLKRMASPTATVMRDGIDRVVPARELVPGDILLITAGDKISADSRLFERMNLQVDEAALTGESTPVAKTTRTLPHETTLAERSDIIFSGTIATYGRGKAVVFATGMQTEFGKIASLIQTDKETRTPLEERMDHLGKWMIKVLLVTVAFVTSLGVFRGHDLIEMFLWGVSLAVAAVPEALPAVVTGAMAVGVYRMARRNSIVRHLPATETLGSTTVICSDKTGTLTKGEMTAKKIYAGGRTFEVEGVGYDPRGEIKSLSLFNDAELVKFICLSGVLSNDAKLTRRNDSWNIIGDPTEAALLVMAAKIGISAEAARNDAPRVTEIPFTSERKIMSTVHKTKQGEYLLAVKGAPEVLLSKCGGIGHPTSTRKLEGDARKLILEVNDRFAADGFRVLAIGCKLFEELPTEIDERIEFDLTFLGLVAMIDPPREEAIRAVELCEKAGIRVIMITGDHKLTATWVARQLRILKEGSSLQLTGPELDNLTDQEFAQKVDHVAVYSRTSPEHKMRIITALKQRGNIVAMTGDGINDAPALKKSDIGISMGIAGTDVARESSDMILADDNFASIVAAVHEGRGIFENIRKYLTYLISANIGEILIMAVAGLVALPLPLLAKHLLFVNLATDGLPALALGTEPPDPRIMEKPPRNPREGVFEPIRGWLIGIALLTFATAMIAFVYGLLTYGWTFEHQTELAEVKARSMTFATIVLFEIFFALSCRSFERTFSSIGPFGNKSLLIIVLGQALTLPFFFQIPQLAGLFSVTALTLIEWLIVLTLGSLGFALSELAKLITTRKRFNREQQMTQQHMSLKAM